MSVNSNPSEGGTRTFAQPSVFNSPSSSSTHESDEAAIFDMGLSRLDAPTTDEIRKRVQRERQRRPSENMSQTMATSNPARTGEPTAGFSTRNDQPTMIRHRSATSLSEPATKGSLRSLQPESYDDISSRLGVDPQLDWIVRLISDGNKNQNAMTRQQPQPQPQYGMVMEGTTIPFLVPHEQGGDVRIHDFSHGKRDPKEVFSSVSPVTPTEAQYAVAHMYSTASDLASSSATSQAASGLPHNPFLSAISAEPSTPTHGQPTSTPSRPLSSFVRRATMSTPQSARREARGSPASMTSFRIRTEESREVAPACDFCRRRKVKCDRQQPQCTFCVKHGVYCTQNDQLRKRGPPTKDQRIALERAGLRYDRSRRKLMPMSASSPCLSRSSQSSASSSSFPENAVAGPSVLSAAMTPISHAGPDEYQFPSSSSLSHVPTSVDQERQWTSHYIATGPQSSGGAPLQRATSSFAQLPVPQQPSYEQQYRYAPMRGSASADYHHHSPSDAGRMPLDNIPQDVPTHTYWHASLEGGQEQPWRKRQSNLPFRDAQLQEHLHEHMPRHDPWSPQHRLDAHDTTMQSPRRHLSREQLQYDQRLQQTLPHSSPQQHEHDPMREEYHRHQQPFLPHVLSSHFSSSSSHHRHL